MPRISKADLAFSLSGLQDQLFSWLEQQGLDCADGLPHADLCDDFTGVVVTLIRELKGSSAASKIDAAWVEDEPTRHTAAREILAFNEQQTEEQLLDWYRALPAWEAAE